MPAAISTMCVGAGVGEIRISASPSVATGLVPRAVLAFKRARPRVSFLIQEGVYPDVLSAVRIGEIDFAICLVPERPRDDALHFENLLADRLIPAVRVNHPLFGARKLTLGDLVAYDWVIYRRTRTGWDIFEQTFLTNGYDPPRSTIECTSFACALALVGNSDAITLVPSHIFAESWRPAAIAPVLLDSDMPPWQVMVISRAQHELSPVCVAFLEELRRMGAKLSAPAGAGPPPKPRGRRTTASQPDRKNRSLSPQIAPLGDRPFRYPGSVSRRRACGGARRDDAARRRSSSRRPELGSKRWRSHPSAFPSSLPDWRRSSPCRRSAIRRCARA